MAHSAWIDTGAFAAPDNQQSVPDYTPVEAARGFNNVSEPWRVPLRPAADAGICDNAAQAR